VKSPGPTVHSRGPGLTVKAPHPGLKQEVWARQPAQTQSFSACLTETLS